MRAITIDATSAESAVRLAGALQQFNPELSGSIADGYQVTIELGSSDHEILAIIDVLEDYVSARNAEPSALRLEGRTYTVYGRPPA
jgi:hypothetical protein